MTPTPALPMWLEVLKAVAPLIAALLAAGVGAYVAHKFGTIQAGIAQQQAETARAAATTAKNKLKLDLFDRRLLVFEAAKRALTNTENSLGNEDEVIREFTAGTLSSRWLFGDEIYDFMVSEMAPLLDKISSTSKQVEVAENEQLRGEAYEELSQLMADVFALKTKLMRIFEPYLKLES